MRRLSFSARFALVLTLLGAVIGGTTVAISLADSGTRNRQAALDRVASRSADDLRLLDAERFSLTSFASAIAGQTVRSGDVAAFLAEVSATTAASDTVAAVGVPGQPPLLAEHGSISDPPGAQSWLLSAAEGSSPTVHDPTGAPWLLARAGVPGGGVIAVARPLRATAVLALHGGGSVGIAVVTAGRYAVDGTVAGTAVRAGAPVIDGLRPAATTDSPSADVRIDGIDVAAASVAIGGGVRLLFTSAVEGSGDSLLRGVAAPVVIAVSALILIGLIVIYRLVQHDLRHPLQRLDRAVAAVADDDFTVPVAQGGAEEVRRLASSFEAMRAELGRHIRGIEAQAAIATDLSAVASLDRALTAACTRLCAATGAHGAVVVVADPRGQGGTVHTVSLGGLPPASRLLRGHGAIGAAFRLPSSEPLIASPLPASPEAMAGIRELAASPLRLGTKVLGVIALCNREGGFRRQDGVLLAVVSEQVALAIERDRILASARLQANTDGLTGLYNRRFLADYLEQQAARADRQRMPFTLLMLDVDHFKAINDIHGHDAGDQALGVVARTLTESLRRSDLAARLGGDEFVVVMGETDVDDAAMVAEKVREAIRRSSFTVPATRRRVQLSASIGVARRRPNGIDVDRLLILADNALYEAKRQGRDRVVIAEDPADDAGLDDPAGKRADPPLEDRGG